MISFRGVLPVVCALLAMAGVSVFSSKACAQQRTQGEFQLSQTTHWDKSILPEGKYLYSVETGRTAPVVRVWQVGGNFSGVFVPNAPLREDTQAQTEIVLHQVGDGMYVSSFRVRGLKTALDFITPEKAADSGETPAAPAQESATPDSGTSGLFKIVNPSRVSLSIAGAERVYLNACRVIEEEFSRTAPIRPQVILHLGAAENVVRYPNNEILLKKWDEYRFAQAIVEIAIHEMVSSEERLRLSDQAVNLANTTVSVCDLKNCRN
ncbi:MAG: hypothetical protein LAO19_14435 [Acidobacteriia bacterium]|nr:hypothetical protein [Terriglobia bacterium]